MSETVREQFTDPVSGTPVALVIPPGGRVLPQHGQPKIGVEHPGCPELADVSVGLDAFYCPACRLNGRVSGGWVLDRIEAAHEAASRNA